MNKLFLRRFTLSATTILGVTGIAKLLSGVGDAKILAVIDPVMRLKFGQLMLIAGGVEVAIAFFCFISKRQILAVGLVAWIATVITMYRLGLWWMDWQLPCSCLGNLTDALHVSPKVVDNIMKVLLTYLLIASYMLLFLYWRQSRSVTEEVRTIPNQV